MVDLVCSLSDVVMPQLHRFGKQFRDGRVPEAKLESVHVELDPTLLDRLNIISKISSFSRQSSHCDSLEKDAHSLYLPMNNIAMVSLSCVYICVYVCICTYVCNVSVCKGVCVCVCMRVCVHTIVFIVLQLM